MLLSVAMVAGTTGVIAAKGGPPEGEGNASKAEYKPPCERDLFKRIREHQQQREGERRPFRRSAADEKEGHRLAAQGLEGCKG